MHFFNPAPVMRLLEVVAGEQCGEQALALARATGDAMGKRVILAADGPGFLVNRCNRPFGLEALRLLSERVATSSRSTGSCASAADFGWALRADGPSASTSASRSPSASTSRASASRAGGRHP